MSSTDLTVIGNNLEALICAALLPGSTLIGDPGDPEDSDNQIHYIPEVLANELGFESAVLNGEQDFIALPWNQSLGTYTARERYRVFSKNSPWNHPYLTKKEYIVPPVTWFLNRNKKFAIVDSERLQKRLETIIRGNKNYCIRRPVDRVTQRSVKVAGLGEMPTEGIISTLPLNELMDRYPYCINKDMFSIKTFHINVLGGKVKKDFHVLDTSNYHLQGSYRIDHYGNNHVVNGVLGKNNVYSKEEITERVTSISDKFGDSGYFGDVFFVKDVFISDGFPDIQPYTKTTLHSLECDRIHSIGMWGKWDKKYNFMDLYRDVKKIGDRYHNT